MPLVTLCALLSIGQIDADAGQATSPPLIASEPTATPAPEAAPARAPAATPMPRPEEVQVETNDGQRYTGVLEFRGLDGSAVVRLANGTRIDLPGASVKSVQPVAQGVTASGWFADPNRTRYLYGPSAMMLKQGELTFSQTELVVSTLSYGITDWFTVQVGGAVPFWFVPPIPSGFNVVAAAKLGVSVTERIHLAVGAQTLVLPGLFRVSGGTMSSIGLLGLAFGTFTYGTPDAHVSVSIGVPFAAASGLGGFGGSPIFTLSGNLRVARSVALISENWLVFVAPGSQTSGVAALGSVGVRIMGEQMAVDLGLLVVGTSAGGVVPFPVPWLNFTYNFGNVLKN